MHEPSKRPRSGRAHDRLDIKMQSPRDSSIPPIPHSSSHGLDSHITSDRMVELGVNRYRHGDNARRCATWLPEEHSPQNNNSHPALHRTRLRPWLRQRTLPLRRQLECRHLPPAKSPCAILRPALREEPHERALELVAAAVGNIEKRGQGDAAFHGGEHGPVRAGHVGRCV